MIFVCKCLFFTLCCMWTERRVLHALVRVQGCMFHFDCIVYFWVKDVWSRSDTLLFALNARERSIRANDLKHLWIKYVKWIMNLHIVFVGLSLFTFSVSNKTTFWISMDIWMNCFCLLCCITVFWLSPILICPFCLILTKAFL